MIRQLSQIKKGLFRLFNDVWNCTEFNRKKIIESLQQSHCEQSHKSLIPFGYKIYSRNEEDGIINEIFKRIGTTNKIFIEFGVGDGLENNTLALLLNGWKGLWIEGCQNNVKKITNGFEKIILAGILQVRNSYVTPDNINTLISEAIQEKEIDLLSIDIDGNDYHVFNSISCINPRVLVIEYNAKFPPPILYCMRYDENYRWQETDCFGASLKYYEIKLKEKGYLLIGCNLTGGNAFFVKDCLVQDNFLSPYTAENHYQPPRYELSGFKVGHNPSYKTLDNFITERGMI